MDLLTPKQAMERLNIGERTLRKLRKAGLIAYVALTDRKFMYRPEDCDAFIESRLRRDEPPPRKPKVGRSLAPRHHGQPLSFEEVCEKRGW